MHRTPKNRDEPEFATFATCEMQRCAQAARGTAIHLDPAEVLLVDPKFSFEPDIQLRDDTAK